jgi:hypothetical protein
LPGNIYLTSLSRISQAAKALKTGFLRGDFVQLCLPSLDRQDRDLWFSPATFPDPNL